MIECCNIMHISWYIFLKKVLRCSISELRSIERNQAERPGLYRKKWRKTAEIRRQLQHPVYLRKGGPITVRPLSVCSWTCPPNKLIRNKRRETAPGYLLGIFILKIKRTFFIVVNSWLWEFHQITIKVYECANWDEKQWSCQNRVTESSNSIIQGNSSIP